MSESLETIQRDCKASQLRSQERRYKKHTMTTGMWIFGLFVLCAWIFVGLVLTDVINL